MMRKLATSLRRSRPRAFNNLWPMTMGICDLMDWQSHADRSRFLARKGKKTKKSRSPTQLRSSARRIGVKCCKSGAYMKRKRIRYTCDLLLAEPFTHRPRKL